MNVTIIKFKDIIRYIIFILVVLFIVIKFLNISNKKEENDISEIEDTLQVSIDKIEEKNLISNINSIVPLIKVSSKKDEEYENDKEKIGIELKMLNQELDIINNTKLVEDIKEENNEDVILDNEENTDQNNEQQNVELAQTGVTTQVIDENNITATYTNNYDSVQIKNQTDYNLSEIINNVSYNFTNTKKIAIYHTHTTESYSQSENYKYTMTGDYRTTDLNYSVCRVGDELEKQLTEYGYEVIHDKTYHDYPSYNGSYGRSLTTLQNILNANPDVEVAIDLHRDAVGSSGSYGPRVKIGEENCAQLMFVIGTDGSGLLHPNWRQNLQFAMKTQQIANELYPGLFRPINLRTSRFNQHLTTASSIIEVGATGNTLDECLASMKYLAKVLSEVVI